MKLAILCALFALVVLSAQAMMNEDHNILSNLLDVHENFDSHDAKDLFAAGDPTAEPTAEPSAEPSAEPTIAPSGAPGVPTLAPVSNPSAAPSAPPSVAPTAVNSVPSVAPTVAPTVRPTARPSAQVTLRPSAAPTVTSSSAPGQPSARPTARPSTAAPTKMSSPILSFNQNFTLSGSLTSTLSLNDQQALLNTTAWSMGVTVNTLTYLSSIATPENRRTLQASGSRGLRSSGMSLFTTSWTIRALTQLNLPLDTTTYTNATKLYQDLTQALSQAVNDGSFTTQLQVIALLLEADALQVVTVQEVEYSPASVNNLTPGSSGSNDDLSDGAIAGIVIGCVVGAALIAAALYYFFFLREGASKHEAFQSNSDVEISL